MPFCTACGRQNPDDARFCSQCGTRLVTADPAPEALVVDLAGSSVNIRARWWINPPLRRDVVRSMDEALHAIKDALTAEGIDLPFPTRQILLHDQTEATDGDRSRQREGWPAAGRKPPRSRWQVRQSEMAAREGEPASAREERT